MTSIAAALGSAVDLRPIYSRANRRSFMRTLVFVIVGLIGVHSLIAQAPTRQRGEQVMVAVSDHAAVPTATGVVIGIPGDRVRFSQDAGVLVNGEAVSGVPADVLTLLPPVAIERTVPEG